MEVDRIPFLVTISCHIQFGTVEFLLSWQMAPIHASIKVHGVYLQWGFHIIIFSWTGSLSPYMGHW